MKRLRAHAKINLALVVGPARADGKHEVATVLQRISLADTVALAAGERLSVSGFADDTIVTEALRALAAIAGVDWSKAGNDPKFLVVIGVGPEEAILADTSTKRTARDQSAISAKVLAGMVAA